MSNSSLLGSLTREVQREFSEARTILSYTEYIELLEEQASVFCRSAAQYIHDAFLFFGSEDLNDEYEQVRQRFRLFDNQEEGPQSWVAGQEHVQASVFRALANAVRSGRSNQLLLLHGPNGSGKSSLVSSLIRALELYSHTSEGTLYRFNWIFPTAKLTRSGIGFGAASGQDIGEMSSYAHLAGDQVDARVPCPMKDHPLLLLPLEQRNQLLDKLEEEGRLPDDFQRSDYLRFGQISHRSKKIFDALMLHYNGDFNEVLKHVQVERFYISQRYRVGAVSIEPQMRADAAIRQVTADHSLASLPKYLSTLNLFEPVGAIVDSNRGVLEFSDLLKRPVEAFKYLLNTCETGRVSVEPTILFLDLFMIGTANELNLEAFKEHPEFMSFKSRIHLVRVPYLLRYSVESGIYDQFLTSSSLQKEVTPHVTRLASMWAVMTRLKKPEGRGLKPSVQEMVETISPLEKVRYYNDGIVPSRFSDEEARQLRQVREDVLEEHSQQRFYEGRLGASPREIQSILLNAAQNAEYPCLSPLALFAELEEFLKERGVYAFLQLEPKEGYHDAEQFIEMLREEHLNILDREFRVATGLVTETQHEDLFLRYVKHVKAVVQKERVLNPVTHKQEDPDTVLMDSVEEVLLNEKDNVDEFRQNIISKIAARSLDNPSEKVDLTQLFSDSIERLKQSFYSQQPKRLKRAAQHCLMLLFDEEKSLEEKERVEASEVLERFCATGYSQTAAKEEIAHLLRYRYEARD